MRTIIVWILCTLYATFFLGSVPIPPAPGRAFSENGSGASRFAAYDGISRRLTEWGAESSFLLAIGILVVLFALWMLFRSSAMGGRRSGVPIVSFLFLLMTAFLFADYSRETKVADPLEYGKVRLLWIMSRSPATIYPKWPTEELKKAIQTQTAADIDSALDSVVAPAFGKIPAYDRVFEGCRPLYRQKILEAGSAALGDLSRAYAFACLLMEGVIDRIGKVDPASSGQCLYGPAVKIIHALDRQGLRCPLSAIPGNPDREKTCREFETEFGTTEFSFCR